MFKSMFIMGLCAGLFLFSSVSVVSVEAAEGANGDQLLGVVPAESLFVARINNFDYTLGQIDQFIAGASPMPLGVPMLARMQLAGLLGDPALGNVNTGGSFAAFGIAGAADKLYVFGVIPITDFGAFVSGNANCSEPDDSGISKITSKDMMGQSKVTLIAAKGGFGLICSEENYDQLAKLLKSSSPSLVSVLDSGEIEAAVKEPLWVYGNVVEVSKVYQDSIAGKFDQMKAMVKHAEESTGQVATLPEVFDAYLELFNVLLKEIKSVSFVVKADSQALSITETVRAVPGTDMAKLLATGTDAGKHGLLGFLENGAMMNFSCRMNSPFWRELYDKCFDFMETFSGGAISSEEMAVLKALYNEQMDAMGDAVVFSMSVDSGKKPPFVGKYAFEVKDSEKFNRAFDQCMVLMSEGGLLKFYEQLGIKSGFKDERDVDSYKGVSINSLLFTFKSTQPDSPQGQAIDQMYGDGLVYKWAVVDNLHVWGIGGDADADLREMIDMAQGGRSGEVASEMAEALDLLGGAEDSDFVGTFNYLRMLKMVTMMAPVPMLDQIDVVSNSNIAFAGKIGGGDAVMDIVISKQHMAEIMSVVMQMQQQMQQEMQGQMQHGSEFNQSMVQQGQSSAAVVKRVEVDLVELPVEIDGLAFGMTSGQMEEVLGTAESSTGGAYYYFGSGLAVLTGGDGTVDAVILGSASKSSSLTENCKYRTKKGIGMGSSTEDVVAAYGTPSSVNDQPKGSDCFILEYKDINARFSIKGEQVVHMVFRKPSRN